MTSKTLTLAALLAPLVLSGCSARAPAEASPRLVTLATFEGEIDPDAGTFFIHSLSPAAESAGATGKLVLPESGTTVSISSPVGGASHVTNGCSAGVDSLEANVTITVNYSQTPPTSVGAIYAEISSLSPATGYEGCNSATAPTGLSATNGLWSYGTIRPSDTGVSMATVAWKFKWNTGTRSTFTGRIVGVLGTTFANSTDLPAPYVNSNHRAPLIVYARGKVAYASGSGTIVYVNLDGTYASKVTLPNGPGTSTPESANALDFYTGTSASTDVLWFSTLNHVGVVHGGTVYASRINGGATYAGNSGGASVAVNPDVASGLGAWFASRGENGIRSATFDPAANPTPTVTIGGLVATSDTPFGVAAAPATAPATGNFLYVESNAQVSGTGNWIKSYTTAGVFVATLATTANYCGNPIGLFPGPDGKLWFGACENKPSGFTDTACWFCSYAPSSGVFQTFDTPHSSSSVAFGKSVMGSSADPWVAWGLDIDHTQASPLNVALQFTSTGTSTKFAMQFRDRQWDTAVPFGAGSPEVTVSGTNYPPFLWVLTGYGLLRLQP